MKKSFVSIFFLAILISNFIFGEEFINDYKSCLDQPCWEQGREYFLKEVNIKRDDANSYLSRANFILPDIEIEGMQQFKNLIRSFKGSFPVEEPKTQFLSIALEHARFLENFDEDLYEDVQVRLVRSAACLEESNYYKRMAQGLPLNEENYDYCNYFMRICPFIEDAFKYLILADMYIGTLEPEIQSLEVFTEINRIREAMISEIEKHGKLNRIPTNDLKQILMNLPDANVVESDIDYRTMFEIFDLIELTKDSLVEAKEELKIQLLSKFNDKSFVSSPRAIQTCWEGSKQHYLKMAKSFKEDADYYLEESLSILEKLTNSDDKEKSLLRALISSFMAGTVVSQDIRGGLAAAAFTLIEQWVEKIYLDTETLILLRRKLVSSAAHLETSIYFNRMALGAPLYSEFYDYCDYYLEVSPLIEDAIQYLILMDMYLMSLKNQIHSNEILDRAYNIRSAMISEIEKHGTIITIYSESVTNLSYNIQNSFKGISDDISATQHILNLLSNTASSLKKAEAILKKEGVIKIPKISGYMLEGDITPYRA